MREFGTLLPQETVDKLRAEWSVIPSTEAAKVGSLATLVCQTINSEYQAFIPLETMERNFALGKKVIVTDDLMWFGEAMDEPEFIRRERVEGLAGWYFPQRGVTGILNPEIEWGKGCPHCQAIEIAMVGSEEAAREQYKGKYYTTFIAHEAIHQYQDHSLPQEFKEVGAYYYTSIIARNLGHDPLGDEFAAMRYDAYEALLRKYGDDVHRVFFGSANTGKAERKKPRILQKIQKQRAILFPNGLGL